MLWIVFTVILLLIGMASWAGRSLATEKDSKDIATFGIVAALVGLVIALLVSSIDYVAPGHVGISKSLGKWKDTTASGVIFHAPWADVISVSQQQTTHDFSFGPENSAGSKENQEVYADLTVNLRLAGTKDEILNLYTTVGENWFDKLVPGRVADDFKSVVALYQTASITPNREAIRRAVARKMSEDFKKYALTVPDVQLKNIDFSAEWKQAVEAKQVQTQRALEARAKVAEASAEGEQSLVKARKQAAANRVLAHSLTDRILRQQALDVQREAIDKLNPNVSVIYLPTGSAVITPQPDAVAPAAAAAAAPTTTEAAPTTTDP